MRARRAIVRTMAGLPLPLPFITSGRLTPVPVIPLISGVAPVPVPLVPPSVVPVVVPVPVAPVVPEVSAVCTESRRSACMRPSEGWRRTGGSPVAVTATAARAP